MMKLSNRLIAIFISALVISTLLIMYALPASAQTEGRFTFTVSDGEATITDVDTSIAGNINVPSTLGGYPVVAIGDNAFLFCSDLKGVTVPEGVRSIGRYAFSGCNRISSVKLPQSLTAIGDNAFSGCVALSSVEIPAGVSSIGREAFYFCGLQSITVSQENTVYKSVDNCLIDTATKTLVVGCNTSIIPNDGSVTAIAEYAFAGCTELESIVVPSNITSIGKGAFSRCANLTSVELSEGILSVGEKAFFGCTKLEEITFPASVTYIGDQAIRNCYALQSISATSGNANYFSIGNCLVSIQDKTVMAGCGNSVIPSDSRITAISAYAFYGQKTLESVNIPSGITSIGERAFAECTGLKRAVIPSSLTELGEYAFHNCRASIKFMGSEEQWNELNDGFWTDDEITYTVNFGEDSIGLEFAESADKTSYVLTGIGDCIDNFIVIPKTYNGLSVTAIASQAFFGNKELRGIQIPSSVTSIAQDAFYGCEALEVITVVDNPIYHSDSNCLIKTATKTLLLGCQYSAIPSNGTVTSIADRAFAYARKLDAITIPSAVQTIGDFAFYKCSGLESLTISGGVKSIGNEAFSGCSSLTSVIIPDSVTNIDALAFYNCTSLKNLTVGKGVTSIGSSAFLNCAGLETISVSSANTVYSASGNCLIKKATKTVIQGSKNSVIPQSGVTSIADNAFGGITSLESIKIPANIVSVGDYAFKNCRGLTALEIASGVTSIGEEAFYGCSALTSVVIPNSVSSLGDSVFYGCSELTSATVGNGISTLPPSAFAYCKNLTNVSLSSNVTTIGSSSFFYCTGLKHITIPTGVTTAKEGAFAGCTALSSVTLPSGFTTIKYGAFADCQALERIIIPESVTKIGSYAFYGCGKLSKMYYEGTQTTWDSIDKGDIGSDALIFITYSRGLEYTLNSDKASYTLTGVGTCTDVNIIVPSSYNGKPITAVGDYVFASFWTDDYALLDSWGSQGGQPQGSKIRSIELPDTVTVIGEGAFLDCIELTSITLPQAVVSIGDYAFSGCVSLETIALPDSVTSIGEEAFFGCEGLTSIEIPAAVTYIGTDAFGQCISVETITVAQGNTAYSGQGNCLINIAEKTLIFGCKNSVIPSGTVTIIGKNAFYGCEGLTSIVIPQGIETIDSFAFRNCTSLVSVNLPESIKSIGYYAFAGSRQITRIDYYGTQDMWETVSLGNGWISHDTWTLYTDHIVIFEDYNGKLISETRYHYGDTVVSPEDPTRVSDDGYVYIFAGWDKDVVVCTEDVTYVATYTSECGGHTYLYGECDICGEAQSEQTPELATLQGKNLSLNGDIRYKFLFLLSDEVLADDGAFMRFTVNGAVNKIAIKDITSDASLTFVSGDKTYYIFAIDIAAKEMSDTISIQTVTKDKISTVEQWSVKDYAEIVIKNEQGREDFAKAAPMLKAMLNYGAYAQLHFGHNTDDLANVIDGESLSEDMSAIDQSTLAGFDYANDQCSLVTLAGSNLTLEAKITVQLRFKLNTASDLSFSYNGEALEYTRSGDYAIIAISNIVAKALDDDLIIEVSDQSTTESFKFSAMTYCYTVLGKETNETYTDELKDALKALYLYNVAADEYFANEGR